MKRAFLALMVVGVCALPTLAPADWDPASPDPDTKWVQMPDPNGWDVKVTSPKILADDFPCYETEYITDVHLWGSWEHDWVGKIDWIYLSFHDNVPAGVDPNMPWSHPGDLLWAAMIAPDTAPTGAVVIREWGTGKQGWYDPNTGEYIPEDHNGIWQVNIFLDQIFPLDELFVQRGPGGPTDPTIYWLDVMMGVSDPTGLYPYVDFGWKTSDQVWNDDAVWGDEEPPIYWRPLEDPVIIRSLDMAFVITGIVPEPGLIATCGLGLLALLALRRRK